jgi:hypothetical protein
MEIKAIDGKDRMVFKRHIPVDDGNANTHSEGGGGGSARRW